MMKQRGVTLIEVLVTILILGIGLLGVAGLQTVSLHNTANVYLESQVQTAAQDLINRIIANPAGANNGDYATTALVTSAPSVNCSTATCSASQMAQYDLYQWSSSLNPPSSAPAGSVSIPGVAASVAYVSANQEYQISITWDAKGQGASYTAPTCNSTSNSSIGCLFVAYRTED